MLPQLIEEDMRRIDSALGDLLTKSEATSALVLVVPVALGGASKVTAGCV